MQGAAECAHVHNDEKDDAEDHTMVEDLQRMLRDAAFSDMVFVCGSEEEEITACRMLVASRSPVLESMLLRSGMAESRLERVRLPDIEPSTMRICIEFFYTDAVQDSSWCSILSAMKVVKAAMFFLSKRLECLARAYMHVTSFRKESEDNEWNTGIIAAYNLVLQLYSEQLSNGEKSLMVMSNLLDKFRVYVQNRVGCSTEQLLSGCSRERLFYRNLSDLALAHIIDTPKRVASKRPLTEYFGFLHVVRWSASRLVLSDASIAEAELEEVLNRCFPRSLDLLSSAVVIDLEDMRVSKYMKLLSKPLAEALHKIPLNFAKIPSNILCRFIEPLHVIPRLTLLSAYRVHALSNPDLRWDPLGHAKKYSIDKNDISVISCSRKEFFRGFARCSTYLSNTTTAFFEWEIAILTLCERLRIGFYVHRPMVARSVDYDGQVLGDEKGSWALGRDGILYGTTFENAKSSAVYVYPFHGKEETIVQVHLDMTNNHCSFTINGKEAGVAWRDLPLGKHMVYPAVSLERPGKVQVRRIQHSWMEGPPKRRRLSKY